MAAPTAPTTTSLATEALLKAGYSSPTTAQLTNAWDYWGEEVKHDIWNVVKDLKFLQSECVIVTSEGLSRYSFPSDLESLSKASLLDGQESGVCQDGGDTTSVILASDIEVMEDWIVGKYLVVYLTATPTTAYISQCIDFDTTTKVATISPEWSPSPDSTYSYIVIDRQKKLDIDPIWKNDDDIVVLGKGEPSTLYPLGDEDYGEFNLDPAPSDAYPIRLRYYINLLTLDKDSTLHATLLMRWRNIFIQGILAKQFQADDDDRVDDAITIYTQYLNMLKMREKYGDDLSELQAEVND